MARWASVVLVVALGTIASGQTADVIREHGLPDPLRVAPFGGILNARQPGQPSRGRPDRVAPPRPVRPAAPTLPASGKLDRHGDALPAGAVARYGTVRLRHGTQPLALAFSPDGKLLASVGAAQDGVRLWDPDSGKLLYQIETPVTFAALAHDGSVVIADGDRCKVWQPAANVVRNLPDGTLPAGTTALTVHPDSGTFAAAAPRKVVILDILSGKPRAEYKIPNDQPPLRLAYSPDGRWLAGSGDKTGVWLWDTRTGKRVRTYPAAQVDQCEFAFSADSNRIAIATAQLQVYSADSEEMPEGYVPPDANLINPRFSADGKFVLAQTPGGVVMRVDAETGAEKDKWDPPEPDLRPPVALAPGGRRAAAVDQAGGIRIWEPKTGNGPEVERLPLLADPGVAADGRTASCLAYDNKVHVFDPLTGKPVRVIDLGVDPDAIAFYAPRCGRVAVLLGDPLDVHVHDAATGKRLAKLPGSNESVPNVAFHPTDPDRVAVLAPGSVGVYSLATAQPVRSFTVHRKEDAPPDLDGCFSPDGRLIALTTHPLSVWEVATGKRRFEIDTMPHPQRVVFSPDGRLVAAADPEAVVVFDVRTGTTVRRVMMPGGNVSITAVSFTPDSKRVVTGDVDGMIVFWDVITGDAVLMLDRHDGEVTGLAFSADGKRLVSTADDGTALVWDLSQRAEVKTAAVGGSDEAFRLLAATDAAQAQRGIAFFIRQPDAAVNALAEQVPIPPATPADKVARLVAGLSSEDFQTRQAAVRDLAAVGSEAIPAVRAAAERSPSPEVKKLAAEVLGKLESPPTRPDDLRALRAVEVLEVIGTPAARDVLKRWAAGPPGTRLTTEAAAALARLKP